MLQVEYIANAGHDAMKTRTPAIGVLVSIILFVFFSRGQVVSRCLLLESFKHLVAVLLALRAGIRQSLHQPQLVGTLIARGLYLVEQIIQFQGQYLPIHIVYK